MRSALSIPAIKVNNNDPFFSGRYEDSVGVKAAANDINVTGRFAKRRIYALCA
jgi:hypothetical protein